MEQKQLLQKVNLSLIKDFLNDLESKSWFGSYEVGNPDENLNLIWNIMYLYESGYIKSAFLDEEVPVVYTSETKAPTIIKNDNYGQYNSAMSLKWTKPYEKFYPELDAFSAAKMNEYSKNRKYVRGYDYQFQYGSLTSFYYFNPFLTESGIALRDLLNESSQKKRKERIESWIESGSSVMKFIATLVPLILNFVK